MPLDAALMASEEYDGLRADLDSMADFDLAYLAASLSWRHEARPNQLAPDVAGSSNTVPPGREDWTIWLANAGRGWGKTRTGAQCVFDWAYDMPGSIIHVVARTGSDLRLTVFEGPAGLCSVVPSAMVRSYNRSTFSMRLWNGTVINGFSAEEPNKLRGPQSHATWCDEVAAWQYASEAWSQVVFSTRLRYERSDGTAQQPRIVATTTPKPIQLVRDLRTRSDVVVTLGSSYDNRRNLGQTFFDEITKYEGTTIGRQEIHGELIDPEEAGVVKRSWLRLWPHDVPLPAFEQIIISGDTAMTEETFDKKKGEPDFSAFGTWGVFEVPLALRRKLKSKMRWGFMLLDVWHERLGMPDLIERVREDWDTGYGGEVPQIQPQGGSGVVRGSGRKPDTILIEDKGSGITLRQMLNAEDIPVVAWNPGRADKLQRLHAVSHIPHGGAVWIVESSEEGRRGQPKDWYEPWISEVCAYSGEGTTAHDDFVDMTSQALHYLHNIYLRGGVRRGGEDEEKTPTKADLPRERDRWSQTKRAA